MSITPKKLCQSVIATSMTAVYTTPAATKTQVTEIWLANTGSTARTVTLATHGTATGNIIVTIPLSASNGSEIVNNAKIVLATGEVLAAKVDAGADVNITAYGIEEA